MFIRYFVVASNEAAGLKADLVPDNDNLRLTELQAVVVAVLQDGRKIVCVIIPNYMVNDMQNQTGLSNPLVQAGVVILDIVDKFVGRTPEEVIINLPELEGNKVVGQDLEGNDIWVPKLRKITWSGQN